MTYPVPGLPAEITNIAQARLAARRHFKETCEWLAMMALAGVAFGFMLCSLVAASPVVPTTTALFLAAVCLIFGGLFVWAAAAEFKKYQIVTAAAIVLEAQAQTR